jgi:acetoin utilization protein AcuB
MRTSVAQVMTPAPHSVGREQPLAIAHKLMRQHGIRHLPVLDHGKLIGILSQRDLYFVETLTDGDPGDVAVEEAMTQDVHTVGPDASLAEIAHYMAEHKTGCTVVLDHGKPVGIFTATDALRVLADMLAGEAPS